MNATPSPVQANAQSSPVPTGHAVRSSPISASIPMNQTPLSMNKTSILTPLSMNKIGGATITPISVAPSLLTPGGGLKTPATQYVYKRVTVSSSTVRYPGLIPPPTAFPGNSFKAGTLQTPSLAPKVFDSSKLAIKGVAGFELPNWFGEPTRIEPRPKTEPAAIKGIDLTFRLQAPRLSNQLPAGKILTTRPPSVGGAQQMPQPPVVYSDEHHEILKIGTLLAHKENSNGMIKPVEPFHEHEEPEGSTPARSEQGEGEQAEQALHPDEVEAHEEHQANLHAKHVEEVKDFEADQDVTVEVEPATA